LHRIPKVGIIASFSGTTIRAKKNISTIYYMLTTNDISAFHRLHDVVEIWYYHAGEPLNIYVIDTNGELVTHHLGCDGEMQAVIQPEQWFAAEISTKHGFCLMGCAVGPAFSFDNFELGKKDDLSKQFPQHLGIINRLCKN